MESFVHAANPKAALAEFSRVLRPSGLVVLYEYDYKNPEIAQSDLRDSLETINKYTSMPANQRRGFLTDLLRETGFQITKTENLSAYIIPMLRLFFLLAFIPYWFIILFGLQKRFINIIAGVQSYQGKEMWRYIAITARKPFNSD
jgi:sterol 24-C-methyltransferase